MTEDGDLGIVVGYGRRGHIGRLKRAQRIDIYEGSSSERARRAYARELVTQWDEYGQGYDASGRLIVCICGEPFPGDDHYCPADEPDPEEN